MNLARMNLAWALLSAMQITITPEVIGTQRYRR